MKKFLLITFAFIAFYNHSLKAQDSASLFAEAMSAYRNSQFSIAYELFSKVSGGEGIDREILSSSVFYAADCLFNLNQPDGAVAGFKKFTEEFRYSNLRDLALYKLGTIYYTGGEYRRARESLMTLLREYPNSEYGGASYHWIGESFAAENKYTEAQEFFKEAISANTDNRFIDQSIYSLAGMYEKTGDYTNAVKYYDQLLAYYNNSPLAPSAQLRIGISYFFLNEFDHAVLELSDPLINKLPGDEQTEAKYYLAGSFVRLKEYKNAAEIFSEILNSGTGNINSPEIQYSLAWVNFQMNDYEEAYKIFLGLASAGTDSLSAKALYWSGECKRYAGKTAEAEKIFNEFLKRFPDNKLASNVKLGVGSIYFNKADAGEAEKFLTSALATTDVSTKTKALVLLGEIELNKSNFNAARDYFSQANKLNPPDGNLLGRTMLGLGITAYYLGDFDGSARTLEQLLKNDNNFEPDKTHFYLAEAYFAKENYTAALKNYNQVNTNDAMLKKETLFGKSYTYFNLKDFANAVYYFNDYIKSYRNAPDLNDAKLRLADSYYGLKNYDKASAIYKELFFNSRSSINNDFAYYQYCQALFKAGRASEAIEAFRAFQQKYPRSKYLETAQYVIGWIYFQQSDFRNAIDNYNLVFEKYPNSSLRPIALYSIADSYFNMGEYDTAIVYYSRVLNEYPNTQYVFDAVNGIQYCYVAKDQTAKAIDFIESYLSANPGSKYGDQISFKKGDIYYSMENYEKAVGAYEEFISAYPNSPLVPNAYYWIGKSASNLKRDDVAVKYFNIVIDKYLKSEIGFSAVIELSAIYDIQKNYSEAIRIIDLASAASPTSPRIPEILFIKAGLLVKEGNTADAYSVFDQIITYYDGNIFAAKSKLEVGLLELGKKNYDGAVSLLKELSEKRTDDIGAEAQYYYGAALMEQGNLSDAISAFVRVRSVFAGYDEWYTRSLLKLGDCYVKLNDKQQARDMYRAVLQRHRADEFANEATTKLKKL